MVVDGEMGPNREHTENASVASEIIPGDGSEKWGKEAQYFIPKLLGGKAPRPAI